MRFTRKEHPEQIEQFAHINPAPIFGPLRCFARCPRTPLSCSLSKGHGGPHVAHTLFKKVAAVWDEQETGHVTALDFFRSRPVWNELPAGLLRALVSKLESIQVASEFAELCERSGMLRHNISKIATVMPGEPDFALGSIAATLTSYANTVAVNRQFDDAKHALLFALMLKPTHVPAWSSMALVSFFTGDFTATVSWADKVLTFSTDPKSADPWERAGAQSVTREGQEFASKAVEDLGAVEAWKEVHEQMRAIKDACRK